MRRKPIWLVAGVATLAFVTPSIAYVVWLRPPRAAVARMDARAHALRERTRRPWEIAPGLRTTRRRNLVPTRRQVHALRARLDCPSEEAPWSPPGVPALDTMGHWKHAAAPPARLVRQLRREPALRAELRSLADGGYGEATDASGRELDEVLMWMVALAHAEDERCFEGIVDAVRVAQAIGPVPRETTDRDLANEMLVLASVERRLVTCSAGADARSRRAMEDALTRLDDARPWGGPPERLLDDTAPARAAVRAELARDPLVGSNSSWLARVAGVDEDLDAIEQILDHGGPGDRLPTELRDRFRFPSSFDDGLWPDVETQLLVGVLRAHGGLDPARPDGRRRLGFEGDHLWVRDFPACETFYDGSVRLHERTYDGTRPEPAVDP